MNKVKVFLICICVISFFVFSFYYIIIHKYTKDNTLLTLSQYPPTVPSDNIENKSIETETQNNSNHLFKESIADESILSDFDANCHWLFTNKPYARIFIDGRLRYIASETGLSLIEGINGPRMIDIVLPGYVLIEMEMKFTTSQKNNRHNINMKPLVGIGIDRFLNTQIKFLKTDIPEIDSHGNPVEKRDGLKIESETGLPFELWLDLTSSVPDCPLLEFVLVPRQKFIMGSVDNDDFKAEKPAHEVTIADPFYISKYEITQGFWKSLGGELISEPNRSGKNLPAEVMDWIACQEIALRINRILSNQTDNPISHSMQIRLPSESEFECACRGGENNRNNFREGQDDFEIFCWAPKSGLHPVGTKKPNQYGLYDMLGSLPEWCEDSWTPDYSTATLDGSPKLDNSGMGVVRGFYNKGVYSCSRRTFMRQRNIGFPQIGVRFVLHICFDR